MCVSKWVMYPYIKMTATFWNVFLDIVVLELISWKFINVIQVPY